eukprot:CAMPEP_0174369490 /NCGR_PEP_ID=MMETSP0811_2-20130205/92652_1 /TAXON_ID=73025 ORGANISM="Eutreptiella gymnastica-like, Strain CCMP1594" /NCGR_SAMPLE_ID=MMETSP0811_2 /ASSEMBLY_ACC=CAM_ASM_000667 /LENGTH=567 /DNA_ID=CAMNT_0015513983 /DNA_START=183 /DNA_END=1883 /DNA_ORIENTATION=+
MEPCFPPKLVPDSYNQYLQGAFADTYNCTADWTPLEYSHSWDDHPRMATRLGLCFFLPDLMMNRTVDRWLFGMTTMFNAWPFFVAAVQVDGLYEAGVLLRLGYDSVLLNPTDLEMQEHCDVLIATGVHPPWIPARPDLPRILVVQDSSVFTDAQTFAQDAVEYDGIVAWSAAQVEYVPEAQRARVRVIPPGLPWCLKFDADSVENARRTLRLPIRKKLLLHIGTGLLGTSIFLNVLSHLPRTWAGVVLSDASQPPSDALGSHPRVHVLEGLEHRMALMYAADVFLLPELEGPDSHLLILEAWAAGIPVFTHPWEWAQLHPDAVFLMDEGDIPTQIASHIMYVQGGMGQQQWGNGPVIQTVRKGLRLRNAMYSLEGTARAWATAIVEAVAEKQSSHPTYVDVDPRPLDPVAGGIHEDANADSRFWCIHSTGDGTDANIPLSNNLQLSEEGRSCFTVVLDYSIEWSPKFVAGSVAVAYNVSSGGSVRVARNHLFGPTTLEPSSTNRVVFANVSIPLADVQGVNLQLRVVPNAQLCLMSLFVTLEAPPPADDEAATDLRSSRQDPSAQRT